MHFCLSLAIKGIGKVAPNPLVGCIIVNDGKVIGQGYHHEYGASHAEVDAINSVKNKKLLKSSTLYVNLEPCGHHGKTPPCADLIIRSGIKYVVIGTIDPNPIVMGTGLQKLVSAGCDVKVGVIESECNILNKRFITYHTKKRPFIILKWAQTADKFIGRKSKDLKKKDNIHISNSASQKLVHQWRAEEQAIMVGTNTALIDNPKLTVRKVKGNHPVRIVLDKDLNIPASFHLLDGAIATILFTSRKKARKKNIEYVTINFKGNVVKQVMNELYSRNITSVIIEGGTILLNSFIKKGIWDEARVFTNKRKWNEIVANGIAGVQAPAIAGEVISAKEIKSDLLLMLKNVS